MPTLLRAALAPLSMLLLFTVSWPLAAQFPAGQAPVSDSRLQALLEHAVDELALNKPLREHRLALSLVDVSNPWDPRYAGLNDRDMMYAASLPKIAILLAGFERIREGSMRYTRAVQNMFTRLTRYSSNEDASRAIQLIGFPYIAKVLTSSKYRLYDPQQNGGLWLGKAYGGPNDRWRRDPLHNISHGATSLQVARFFVMLDQGRLVDDHYSAEIKEILSKPAIRHKFVKGLASKPDRRIYRKSGTWRNWHSDAALVETDQVRYIAVALMEDSRGGKVLPALIARFDDLMCGDYARVSASLDASRRHLD